MFAARQPCILVALLLALLAGPARGGIICDLESGACELEGSGYVYWDFDCNSGNCHCYNSPLSKCFPASAMVSTTAGAKRMADLTLGDEILAVGADGQLNHHKVRFE